MGIILEGFSLLLLLPNVVAGLCIIGTGKLCAAGGRLCSGGCHRLYGGSLPPVWSLVHLVYYAGIVMQGGSALLLFIALTSSSTFLSFSTLSSSHSTVPLASTVSSTVTMRGMWRVDAVQWIGSGSSNNTANDALLYSFELWSSQPPDIAATFTSLLGIMKAVTVCSIVALVFLLPTVLLITYGCCSEMRRGRVIACGSPCVGKCEAFHGFMGMLGSILVTLPAFLLVTPSTALAGKEGVQILGLELGTVRLLYAAAAVYFASLMLMLGTCCVMDASQEATNAEAAALAADEDADAGFVQNSHSV